MRSGDLVIYASQNLKPLELVRAELKEGDKEELFIIVNPEVTQGDMIVGAPIVEPETRRFLKAETVYRADTKSLSTKNQELAIAARQAVESHGGL